jgi:ribose 5-phosphate isomerase B
MKIVIGSDHAGFTLKNKLRDQLVADGHEVQDVGTNSAESTDYPDSAVKVGQAVVEGKAQLGVLCCGTGVGISIAANKIHGIRAAAVSEPVSARMARSHNDANIVCIGERIVGVEVGAEIVKAFLETPFSEGDRHKRRIEKITKLES